jgi:hypothetical protein
MKGRVYTQTSAEWYSNPDNDLKLASIVASRHGFIWRDYMVYDDAVGTAALGITKGRISAERAHVAVGALSVWLCNAAEWELRKAVRDEVHDKKKVAEALQYYGKQCFCGSSVTAHDRQTYKRTMERGGPCDEQERRRRISEGQKRRYAAKRSAA